MSLLGRLPLISRDGSLKIIRGSATAFQGPHGAEAVARFWSAVVERLRPGPPAIGRRAVRWVSHGAARAGAGVPARSEHRP